MSDDNKNDEKKKRAPLSLSGKSTLKLERTVETSAQVRQSFSHGKSKTVQVVKRKKTVSVDTSATISHGDASLTDKERQARMKILETADDLKKEAAERQKKVEEETRRRQELTQAEQKSREEERKVLEEERKQREVAGAPDEVVAPVVEVASGKPEKGKYRRDDDDDTETEEKPRKKLSLRGGEQKRRAARLTVTQALSALDGEDQERMPSMAAMRRARKKQKLKDDGLDGQKQVREIIVPETITVQELSNRLAVRGADVVKKLMEMGVMATITQTIDADTAELLVADFGHRVKRVSESDVELGLTDFEDNPKDMVSRPPVVTVMGHVDHGKTSLLDALRETDVVAKEAGGITQHIGAYQVVLPSGKKITFIDTPGHEAFSEMRSRGANVTDIVVLVVAADDGVMPQTIEAINHAKAAGVPIIVAINKIDKPDATPDRVRNELMQHEIFLETAGGDVMSVEVSAKQKINLDKLEEAILLQADLLNLTANPKRPAQGVVVEARQERGRGSVGTILVDRGTLKVGDIFVAGSEWGRVRALNNDKGHAVDEAGPGVPVEVLGLNGVPLAGDDFVVTGSEKRAVEISEYRRRRQRNVQAAAGARGSLEQMLAKAQDGRLTEIPVLIKAGVQGSVEAIVSSLDKLRTDEVAVRVLHAGVGGINESDVGLANASGALVIGFNVRATPKARDLAKRDNVDIRYYSVIYDAINDVKAAMTGVLSPDVREEFIGNAEIKEVFNITGVGKVAGCMVSEGMVKRGAKVRLLRDNVVIHEGELKTLKRFKDEVKEVKQGIECGMAFANYDDMKAGDVIECFDVTQVVRTLQDSAKDSAARASAREEAALLAQLAAEEAEAQDEQAEKDIANGG